MKNQVILFWILFEKFDDDDDDDHYDHHYQQYFPAGSSDGVHLALWARQACLPQSSLAFIEGDVDDDDDADADDDDDDGGDADAGWL